MTCKRFRVHAFESDMYLVVNNMLNVGDVQSSGGNIRRQKNTTGNTIIKKKLFLNIQTKRTK